MSQRPQNFNIFAAPVPNPMFGSGIRNTGPGHQLESIGGGIPVNFYFQGHNNNVDISVFPGPGSNIHLYGRGRGGNQGGLYLPRLPNEVDLDYTYDWTYEEEKLRLNTQQQSHAEANMQAQAPTVSVSEGRGMTPPDFAEQLNSSLPAPVNTGEAGRGRSRSKQPTASRTTRGRPRGSKKSTKASSSRV
ncbi:unnamed protein product [Orchesella dallaii]|uniref:Uncharacterized protein n=1 Tax=Orchesella dallaii TaxID=48710 RepID=A0ABP1Q816_9HEXA